MFEPMRGNQEMRLVRSRPNLGHLGLRLFCLITMVVLMTTHVRSVRVFRWEQTVSGGLLVTYVVAIVGLAFCAGTAECGGKILECGVRSIYGIRLLGLSGVVILMTLHFRSLRVFRMERTWSGMVLILNAAAIIGLALCVGMEKCGFDEVQAYLCGAGGVLLGVNAISIWRRWRRAGELTRVMAELLGAMGVQLRRQVLIKASLSATAAILMLIDLTLTLVQFQREN